MKLSREVMKKVLGYFATIFPVPTEVEVDRFVDTWFEIVGEVSAPDAWEAARRLMRTIKRFPYPADLLEQIGAVEAERLAGAAEARRQEAMPRT